jgi:diguanylate cyclase (GGDEF)-like protein
MRILIADDDPISSKVLETKARQWGYDVVCCTNGIHAVELITSPNGPELAVLDWMMPGLSGLQVCREVRRRTAVSPYVYMILLTAKDRKEDLLEALAAGVDDYLTKPYDPHEMKARLWSGQRILNLQRELITARDALHIQATHDTLTGLLNRGAIFDIFERELARSQRDHTPLSLMLIDIDHFKQVNDSYGHHCGDTVLQEVTARLKGAERLYDRVGRYGGEEFLVVLPGCDLADARQVAERMRETIAQQPFALSTHNLPVTISLGVVSISGSQDTHDPDELIRAADRALYHAKERGRNRVEIAAMARCP